MIPRAADGALTVVIRQGLTDKLKASEKKQFKTGLEALGDWIKAAEVTDGDGTAATPWQVEYTSKGANLGAQQIVRWDSGVEVGGPFVTHTTYQQIIELTGDTRPENFGLQFAGANDKTITTSSAKAEIAAWLKGFGIDQVEVTGKGTTAKPWTVKYRSAGPTLDADAKISAINAGTTVVQTERQIAHTAYRQNIHVNAGRMGDFKFGFGEIAVTANQAQDAANNRIDGKPPVDKTYAVYTTASGGEFKLRVNFQLGNTAISSDAGEIANDASPNKILDTLQENINKAIATKPEKPDVAPKVLVSGQGTQAFP